MALKLTQTAIAAVFAASLVACGGSDSSSSESDAAAAAAAAEEAAIKAETEAALGLTDASEAADAATDAAGDAVEAAAETAEAAADDAAEVVEAAAEEATDAVEEAVDAVEEVVPTSGEDASGGQTYEVLMLNADPDDRSQRMVFEPAILSVQPGDTVTWVPTDLTHLAASTRGMIPEGVDGWQGRVNQPVSYTFEKPGIYGYNCTPHQAAGMVGLVVVEGEGKLDNLEAAKAVRHPGLAARRWDAIWTDAEAQGLLGG
ncbi:MAG: pseudoazurin [Pseudomonadota bacterium]